MYYQVRFWHIVILRLIPDCFKEFLISQKVRVVLSGTLSQNLDLKKFCHGMSTIVERDNQAAVVGLLLTTLCDGGHGRVLLTVDWQLLPVDHTQHQALCTAHWVIVCEAALHFLSFSAKSCTDNHCHLQLCEHLHITVIGKGSIICSRRLPVEERRVAVKSSVYVRLQIIKGLLKFWPKTCSQKEVTVKRCLCFVYGCTHVYDVIDFYGLCEIQSRIKLDKWRLLTVSNARCM